MGTTKIEWCDKSWNPVTGCTAISEGCQNCYAKRMANRLRGRAGYPEDDPFKVTFHPDRLHDPLKWKKPCRVFVCSMGDFFHKDVPRDWQENVLGVASNNQRNIFIFLTKRPEQMMLFFKGRSSPANCWLGVTAENQRCADERIPILLDIPAAVHFVSVEPMLGPVDIIDPLNGFPQQTSEEEWEQTAPSLDWVIAGPETGQKARPCQSKWIEHLQVQCCDAEVPFFDKRFHNCIKREWPKQKKE